jgi:hypothetical protein
LKKFIRRACGSADFFGGKPDEKAHFEAKNAALMLQMHISF